MKTYLPTCIRPIVVLSLVLCGHFALAQSTWNATNNVSANTNWSTANNWLPTGAPGPATAVRFLDRGAEGAAGSINNVVDTSGAIASLQYANTNGFHTTLISSGVTLTNSGNLMAGTETDNGGVVLIGTATITGAGGSLVMTNTTSSIIVRQGANGVTGSGFTLDLSGLDTFTAAIGRVSVGDAGINRSTGILLLAKTNRITASGTAPAISLGLSGSNNGAGRNTTLSLGQTNAIFANSISVGRQKQTATTMDFNALFTSSFAFFRGVNGVDRVQSWAIGDGEANSGTTSCNGTVNFAAGTVDAQVDVMTVGRASSNTSGSGNSRGTLTLGAGTLDVNTLQVGLQTANTGKNGTGIVNVNTGGTLIVNTTFELAHTTAGAGAALTFGTLNINGGTVKAASDILEVGTAGTSAINVNSGTLDLQPAGDSTPGTITVDILHVGTASAGVPAIVTNVAVINSSSVVIGADGVIPGNPRINIGAAGTFDVSAVPGFTLDATLQGAGTVSGDLILNTNGTISPGTSPGTLTFNNSLTLGGGTLNFDLADPSQVGNNVNDLISVSGNLTLTATNKMTLNAVSGTLSNGTYRVVDYFGALTGDSSYFKVVGTIAQSRHTFAFDTATANQVNLVVGGFEPFALVWSGDGVANTWDTIGAANWNSGAEQFHSLDSVTFNDTGSATPPVNLSGTLVPGSITVSNSIKNYSFTGSGNISTSGALTKQDTGSLTIGNTAANSFGPISVQAGTLTIANSQPNIYPATIALSGGTLALNLPADTVLASTLSGAAGTLVKLDSHALTLSGTNDTFDGAILVNAGTLKPGSNTALGSTNGNTTIASGATLDIAVNSINVGLEQVFVSGTGVGGQGAIINSSGNNNFVGPNLAYVTLTGDTTFGGTGRWDLRAAAGTAGDPATAGLSTGGQPYNLTKVGTNTVNLVSLTVDSQLANIDIKEGLLSFEGNVTSAGNPASTLTVNTNATLRFWQITNLFNKVIVLKDRATVLNGSGSNTIAAPVELQGSNTFSVGGTSLTFINNLTGAGSLIKSDNDTLILTGPNNTWSGGTVILDGTLQIGDGGANGSLPAFPIAVSNTLAINSANNLVFNQPISGPGQLRKDGSGTFTLTGTSPYTGVTTVNAGTLVVNGALTGGGAVTVAGGKLAGTGNIFAGVNVQSGGTLSPGSSIGTLGINGALTLAGTNVMDLNKSGSVLTSDLIQGVGVLTYGGTLQLAITGDPLAAGDSFTLYSAILKMGSFAAIQPPTPGTGLVWDTSELISGGKLKVAAAVANPPTIGSVHLSGSNIILEGSGGQPGSGFTVLTSTNVASPIVSWATAGSGTFDGSGNFSFTNAINLNVSQSYYLLRVP